MPRASPGAGVGAHYLLGAAPAEPYPRGVSAGAGEVLRFWRRRRGISQLELATATGVSTKHLSFVENGRARPSRQLLVHFADALDMPLRERDRLLLAGGHAPPQAAPG